MELTRLQIANYKGLRDVDLPMSRFGCLIGENNSGKSSVLQALSLFFSGSSLSSTHFFDPSLPIRIAVTFSEISGEDLAKLADEHRTKIEPLIKNGMLTLSRCYGTDGKSTLRYQTLVPREDRFQAESVAALVKEQKAGVSFRNLVVATFPELKGTMTLSNNQREVKALIQELADSFPDDQKQPADMDLPTDIDKSVTPFLPEPIYIPAVKDLSDDIKTKEGTPFSKVLRILLKAIEPDLSDAQQIFEELNKRLNRTVLSDGKTEDNRLEQVRTIERTIEKHVQESFSNVFVEIEIPPPDIKTVLSSARIYADDGVRSEIDSKGDGLRRAAAFAILRSYVDLNRLEDLTKPPPKSVRPNEYILLFEEPELYLHPKAQQILFTALGLFSTHHSVLVTTHSPLFFGPEATATFVKLSKARDAPLSAKPFARVHPIDLSDMNAKDQFQIICYENNNAAFFANTVVLVEGDTDYLVFPHIVKLLRPHTDSTSVAICFARIGGKGSIRRYREFFSHFDTQTILVADLDILISGFEQLDPVAQVRELHSALLQAVDKTVDAQAASPEPNGKDVKDAHGKGDLRALWRKARETRSRFQSGEAQLDEVLSAVDEFFLWEKKELRLAVLRDSSNTGIHTLKRNLLFLLRKSGVLILERGDIEAYYPAEITGQDKPSKAQCFCNIITDKEKLLALCANDIPKEDGALGHEFEIICDVIFAAANGNVAQA